MGEDVGVAILRMVVCSAELEEKVHELYEKLSAALPHPHSEALLYIARESRNHSEFFRAIQRVLEDVYHTKVDECGSQVYLDYVKKVLEGLREGGALSLEKVREILERSISLEAYVGEEYYSMIMSPALANILRKYISGSELVNMWIPILRKISGDEKHHERILKLIIKRL